MKEYIILFFFFGGLYLLFRFLNTQNRLDEKEEKRQLAIIHKRYDYTNLSTFLRHIDVRKAFLLHFCKHRKVKYTTFFEGGFKDYCIETNTLDLIKSAFDWGDTKEGYEFWASVDELWQNPANRKYYTTAKS